MGLSVTFDSKIFFDFCSTVKRFLVRVVPDCYVGACFGEAAGYLETDACARTRDYGSFSLEGEQRENPVCFRGRGVGLNNQDRAGRCAQRTDIVVASASPRPAASASSKQASALAATGSSA